MNISKEDLLAKSYSIKKRFLKMYKTANAGHVGCSLSVVEILTFVRFAWWKHEDEIILSKGHAAAALYSMLAEAGTLSDSDIDSFYQNGTYLAAHPPVNKIKGIPFATGSLGHGLSIAAGLGLAQKLKRTQKQIFCVTSDGELNEGATWEAALFIVQHKLDNVVWLIDRNMLQGYGKTEDVMRLEPLSEKLQSFGFNVVLANGHDFTSLENARLRMQGSDRPTVIVCATTKGRHWNLYENKVDCHYLPMTDAQYDAILHDVEKDYQSLTN